MEGARSVSVPGTIARIATRAGDALPTPPAFQVLFVEDDPMIARSLAMGLRYHGLELTAASTVQEGLALLDGRAFDLLMLDVGLPDGSGIELCRHARERNAELPILMLTARDDEATAVAGIEGGADDHVRKPCGLLELAARLKRLAQRPRPQRHSVAFGPIAMDLQRHSVSVEGRELSLPRREYDILALLLRAGGAAVTRDQILTALECDRAIYDRTIDSHLSHLRRKLKDAGAAVRIAAIYGVGYRLEAAA